MGLRTMVVGRIGFDAVWNDLEHRAFGYKRLIRFRWPAGLGGIDLMVRILKTGYSSPMRALEFGANGIMVQHCCSLEEARQWVQWSRFPPIGKRGFDGAGADADFMLANPQAHLRNGNEEIFLALQIEGS